MELLRKLKSFFDSYRELQFITSISFFDFSETVRLKKKPHLK